MKTWRNLYRILAASSGITMRPSDKVRKLIMAASPNHGEELTRLCREGLLGLLQPVCSIGAAIMSALGGNVPLPNFYMVTAARQQEHGSSFLRTLNGNRKDFISDDVCEPDDYVKSRVAHFVSDGDTTYIYSVTRALLANEGTRRISRLLEIRVPYRKL